MNINDIKINNKITLLNMRNRVIKFVGIISSIHLNDVIIKWTIYDGKKITMKDTYSKDEILSWEIYSIVKVDYFDEGLVCKKESK